MDFSGFHEVDFPKKHRIVYVIGIGDKDKSRPFYVGQSSKHFWCRMCDYLSAQEKASTDFKVGEAIKYLQEKGQSVKVWYRESTDPRKDEKEIRDRLASELPPASLLTPRAVRATTGTASPEKVREEIRLFIDNHFLPDLKPEPRG